MIQVDVILVCYNQQSYIKQAVESILLQRVNPDIDVNIIIADDYSTDSTLEIIQSFENKSDFKFIFLKHSCNLGISKNYQIAFQACNGDYIAILEGDDYWSSPYHLQQHIDFLEIHRECSMSMNNITILRDEKNIFEASYWPYYEPIHYIGTKEQIANGNQLGNLSACVLRTQCVKKLPEDLFDLLFADWMLGVMLSQQGLLGLLKESTSVYRTNSNSMWASLNSEQKIDLQIKCIDQYDRFQENFYHQYWEEYKNKLLKRHSSSIKDYLPPFIKYFIKLFIPPIFWKILK